MAESCLSITCTVSIETVQCVNSVCKSTYRSCRLTLGRNEFREVIIMIGTDKSNKKYIMKDAIIHKKFMRNGKATINLINQRCSILISNCQPNLLFLFLRTLATKAKVNEETKSKISMREKLLSEKQRIFQEISPISTKDLNFLNSKLSKDGKPPLQSNVSSRLLKNLQSEKSEALDHDKENDYPKQQHQMKHTNNLEPVNWTIEQRAVISAVLSGSNVFYTGNAGTGKSFLLKRIIRLLPQENTYITASTGIAASQIGGVTLHSFAGIGTGSLSVEQCVQLVKQKPILKQWKNCEHLIIDEISMVDGIFFSKLETVARILRENNKPFGGIQLILTGDFLQLPPVTKDGKPVFCFQTPEWLKCIDKSIILHNVKRQDDPVFIKILNEIRIGRCSPYSEKVLRSTTKNIIEKDGIQATQLCTHNKEVEKINGEKLQQLDGRIKLYESCDSDSFLSSFMDKYCPVTSSIELKKGAQVMLVKNLDLEKGLVNGSRGIIMEFEKNDAKSKYEFPVVKFLNGITMRMNYEKFIIKAYGGTYMVRKQLPLKLAWAISIHKSQGMTLDCIELSLSRVFECGQAYVALSRARSLDGLRVTDFSKARVKANKDVLTYYTKMEQEQSDSKVLKFRKLEVS
ncbi:ATP-dependent DNA helicase PIF1 [Nymphon striatum]|nr:ATP-dependent DNA helicase PIF1 [Nymphon striatum]